MRKHLGRIANGERILAVLAWLWLLVALPFLTDVACNFIVGLILAGTWVLLAVAWLAAALAELPHRLPGWSWRFAAVAGCLGVGLALTDVGLAVRVALSRPWLEAYAGQVAPDTGDSYHEPRWVGLFRLDGTENRGGAVFLYTSQSFINRDGLACIPPSDQSRQFDRISTRPLFGQWHSFEWRF